MLGDIFLRIQTLWKEKNPGKGSGYGELSPLKWRSLSAAHGEVIDMKTPQDFKKKEFTALSEKLKNIISETIENNEHLFLFCGRKGLSPITVCADCGTLVICNNCNAPVVLYGKPAINKTERKNNLFVCQHCGERRDAHELCVHCKGWRLLPLGIGIEKVREEIEEIFPTAKILL